MIWHSIGAVQVAVPGFEFNVGYVIEAYTSPANELRLQLFAIADETMTMLLDTPAQPDGEDTLKRLAEKHLEESN